MRWTPVILAIFVAAVHAGCGTGNPTPTAAIATPPGAVAVASPPPSTPVAPNPPGGIPLASPGASPGASPAAATPATAAQSVWVANTDGAGVYLRKSTQLGDRLNVIAEGTQLALMAREPLEGDGVMWYSVRAPDGAEGYVQVEFTATTQPATQPGPPRGEPK